ncbi:MAG: hypothetical protein EOP22_12305 [Hyphomicrobiales bacterium]|nr:MAG: hypothetical protein EOP22_12305 [Hyphomicrobiales bacterium]
MAKPVDHFRASDISFWGAFALVVWALALLGSNAAGFIPQSVFAGLHASRLEGASLNQLRAQVAALETEAGRLKQENSVLLQRFVLNEQANGEVTRRVGALELTVPRLLDAVNGGQPVDYGTTASTGRGATTFDTDGGSVSYTTTPMSNLARAPQATQPLPDELVAVVPDSNSFGVALGPPLDPDEGEAAWRSVNDRVGALLLGLGPLLANVEGGGGKRLVVGPITTEADARQLCGRMAKVGIACASVPFIGDPLPLLN